MTAALSSSGKRSTWGGGALLQARSLSAGYGGRAAVRDFDLSLFPGEIVALLGANGAGKTTALLALSGELRPLAGEVRWRGISTKAPLATRARDGLGFVPEERSVISALTVADNLNIGRGSVDDALEIFPELRPHLKRRAGLLSGGQQQILTLGRALAAQPAALLIDELSLGLAPVIVSRLIEALRTAADNGVAVLMVEQQVRRALAAADRAYVLRRGRVVLEGCTADLAAQVDQIERAYLGATTDRVG
jgi:branched-chain amino acid transport system ATP-binding protein